LTYGRKGATSTRFRLITHAEKLVFPGRSEYERGNSPEIQE